MPVDPHLLEQVLRTPDSRDVQESPIVTAVILQGPANAADLVPYLEEGDTVASRNARRILCLFDAAAAPHLVQALRTADLRARAQGVNVLWAMLLGEDAATIRETLARMTQDVSVLLDDARPLPDTMPRYIERDFRGRICDLALIVLQLLLEPAFDQSEFRSLDDRGRDEAIGRFKRRVGPLIA